VLRAGVGRGLLGLRVEAAQLAALLGGGSRQRRAVGLGQDVASLYGAPVLRQLEDPELAGIGRRDVRHRAAGLDLAANLHGVDERPARHGGGWHVGGRAASEPARARDDRAERGAADQPAPPRHWTTTSPGSRPAATTTSTSSAGPRVT